MSKMMTRISTTEQLHAAIHELQAANPECRLVFRGQRHDFEPIPSAQRQINDPNFRRAQAIFHSTWDQASSYLLPDATVSGDPFQRLLASMALLQHYGFRSWFVDVTSDPEIAAWFAVHQYISDTILVHPNQLHQGPGESPYLTDHALAVVPVARYERGADGDGFLFVFKVPSPLPNGFSLTEVFSTSALRVHRQKAGELVAPLDGLPLQSLLLATLVIDKSIVLPEQLNTRWLFPPPAEDEVYQKLLRVPFIISEDKLKEEPLLATPGLIQVPLYIYDEHPDFNALSHIRSVTGYYAPGDIGGADRTVVVLPISRAPTIRYTTLPEPPNEFLPKEAVNVMLRSRESALKPVDLSVWKSRRLLLLYPVHQMLVTFLYRDSVYPLFRGLFVDIKSEHSIHIAPLVETLDHLISGDFNTEDDPLFREDFYFLTEKLEAGEATLKQKGSALHYEWVGWEDRQHEDPLTEFRRLLAEEL